MTKDEERYQIPEPPYGWYIMPSMVETLPVPLVQLLSLAAKWQCPYHTMKAPMHTWWLYATTVEGTHISGAFVSQRFLMN